MTFHSIIFSPTGGTKKVTDIIKNEISDSWAETDLCISEEDIFIPDIANDDICIFAVPSFGGRVPEIAINRISKIKSGGARAILVCVYGNREYEDTLTELYDVVTIGGFKCIAAISALAEHSIARTIAKGRPDVCDTAILKEFGLKIREKIKSGAVTIDSIIPGSHGTYKERGKSSSKPVVNDSCTKCGICAKGCPAEAIDVCIPDTTDNEKCISCMKCIAICPQNARSLTEEVLSAVTEKLSKLCTVRKENELFL